MDSGPPRGAGGSRLPRLRKLAARAALVASSCALALVGLELAFRVHYFGWRALSLAQVRSLHPLEQSGLLQPTGLGRPRYELVPGLHTLFKMAPFETNSLGLRDREYTVEKPPNTFRVAVVGDSLTMGSGVPIEDVFHSVVERELNARGGPLAFEVLNFGVGGYGMWDYMGVIENKVPAFEPDLILVCLCGNDLMPEERELPPYEALPERDYSLRLNFIDNLRLRLTNPPPAEPTPAREPAPPPEARETTGTDAPAERAPAGHRERVRAAREPLPLPPFVTETFAELRRTVDRSGTPTVVVGLGTHRYWVLATRDQGLEYVGLGTALPGGLRDRRWWIFGIDRHPNAEANALFAEALLKYLEETRHLPR